MPPLLQVQCRLGLLPVPAVFLPAGFEELGAFSLFLVFNLFCVAEQNQGHYGAWNYAPVKAFRWRTFMTRLVFRASSEPNQLGKADSCSCWISGINNAIRPLLSGCSACSSYYLTSRNVLEAMYYGSATAAILQPHS